EGLRQALERELARRVEALEGQRDAARDRAEVDDRPRALTAEDGQRGAAHAKDAKDVRFELRAGLLDPRVLDRARDAEPRRVHDRVQPALAVDDLAHRRLHGGIVIDVHAQARTRARRRRTARPLPPTTPPAQPPPP